jgi:hypothetical protein
MGRRQRGECERKRKKAEKEIGVIVFFFKYAKGQENQDKKAL